MPLRALLRQHPGYYRAGDPESAVFRLEWVNVALGHEVVDIFESGQQLLGVTACDALAVFVAIASLTILVPVVAYLLMGERGEQVMMSAKDWLIQNNQTVMAVLLLVISVAMIGDAIEILF
jgi:hypothetical protein